MANHRRRFNPNDPRCWQKAADSGAIGSIVTARAAQHPLALGNIPGGITVRDQPSQPPVPQHEVFAFPGAPGVPKRGTVYTDGDWDRSRQRVADQVVENDAAEAAIADRTRESAAAFAEEATAEALADSSYTGANSEAGKGDEAAIAAGRRQSATEQTLALAAIQRDGRDSFLDANLTSEEVGLSTRITDPLAAAGIETVEALIAKSEDELLAIKGFGPHALARVRQVIEPYELKLKGDA